MTCLKLDKLLKSLPVGKHIVLARADKVVMYKTKGGGEPTELTLLINADHTLQGYAMLLSVHYLTCLLGGYCLERVGFAATTPDGGQGFQTAAVVL